MKTTKNIKNPVDSFNSQGTYKGRFTDTETKTKGKKTGGNNQTQ